MKIPRNPQNPRHPQSLVQSGRPKKVKVDDPSSGRSWVKVDGHLTQSGLPKGYAILLFARNFARNFDYNSPVTSTSFEIGFELGSNFEDS